MDDAVWKIPDIPWQELRYPEGHPYHRLENDSIDMAFILTFAPAEADVVIVSQEIIGPAELPVCERVPITLRKVLRNEGPYGPVEVTVAKSLLSPPDGDGTFQLDTVFPPAGVDIISTALIVDLGAGPIEVHGETVIERDDAAGGMLQAEIVSMELTGDSALGPVIVRSGSDFGLSASIGEVVSSGGGGGAAYSRRRVSLTCL